MRAAVTVVPDGARSGAHASGSCVRRSANTRPVSVNRITVQAPAAAVRGSASAGCDRTAETEPTRKRAKIKSASRHKTATDRLRAAKDRQPVSCRKNRGTIGRIAETQEKNRLHSPDLSARPREKALYRKLDPGTAEAIHRIRGTYFAAPE